MAVFEEIQEIIVNRLTNIKPDQITMDSSLIDDLGADSLDVMDLMMAIEEKFPPAFTSEETDKFKSVGDVVRAIDARG